MLKVTFASLLLLQACTSLANAQFTGELSLGPNPNDPSGRTKILLDDFGYNDPHGVGWEAEAGNATDGASIPAIFHPFIGDNWTEEYLQAAILHDHYCDRYVRPWRQTHRLFYDALIDSGLPVIRVAPMYYAVLVGGPKWNQLIEGRECSQTAVCVQNVEGETVASREEIYDEPDVVADVERFAAELEASGEELSPEMIVLRAAQRNPDDIFLNGTAEQPDPNTPLGR
jgi:hypothetical protein